MVTDNEELAIKMRKFGSLSYGALKAGDGRIRLNKSVFQNPNYSRHDDIGLNYRMPEVAAAVGLAQLERIDYFIDKRIASAQAHKILQVNEWLTDKKVLIQHITGFVVKIERQMCQIAWERFEEFGGDGPFGCWKITYLEDLFINRAFERLNPAIYSNLNFSKGLCPEAEKLQPNLLQFSTNQGSDAEIEKQINALSNAIKSFE